MKIALCDDDTLDLEKLKITVNQFILSKQYYCNQMNLYTFTNAKDLLSFIENNSSFDLIISDVIMPEMNGLELAEEIRKKNDTSKIIFISYSHEFAVHSYNVNAYFYLIKPYCDSHLHSLLNKVFDEFNNEKSKSIAVKVKGQIKIIETKKIQYIECISHKIYFYLCNNEIVTSYGTMNEYCHILSSEKKFIKCHKSYIVNMDFVSGITNKDFIFPSKALIPISKKIYQQVKSDFLSYFFVAAL